MALEQDLRHGLLEEETLAEEPRKIDHEARFKFHDKMAAKHELLAGKPKTGDYHTDMGEKHYALADHHRRAHYNHTGEVLKSKNFLYLPSNNIRMATYQEKLQRMM